jgi:hypothetical protein
LGRTQGRRLAGCKRVAMAVQQQQEQLQQQQRQAEPLGRRSARI